MNDLYICEGAWRCTSELCSHRTPHKHRSKNDQELGCNHPCSKGGHSCKVQIKEDWDE